MAYCRNYESTEPRQIGQCNDPYPLPASSPSLPNQKPRIGNGRQTQKPLIHHHVGRSRAF